MAQYVFWTGDEEGVAKAVEEFIRKGLVRISFVGNTIFLVNGSELKDI